MSKNTLHTPKLSETEVVIKLKRKVQENWAALEKAFTTIDRDGSGAIDRGELRQVLERHVMKLPTGDFERLFRKMDLNQNGMVEWHEFLTFFGENQGTLAKQADRGNKAMTEAELRQRTRFMLDNDLSSQLVEKTEVTYNDILKAFELLDQDETGMMSPDELRKVMDRFTLPMSDRQFSQFLAGFEHDFDGCVSWRSVLAEWGGALAGHGTRGGVQGLRRTAKKDLKKRESYNKKMMATRSLNRSVAPRRPASSLGTTGHPIALNDMTELHLDRLVQRLRSKLDCQWGSVRMAFRMTDSDRNGSLSEIEMRQLFDRLDLKVDDTSFDLLLSRIKDSAGDIQYAQFAQLVAPSETGGVASDIQSGYNDVESWGGDAHGRQRAEGKHDSLLGNTHGTRKEATIPLVTAERADQILKEKMALQFTEVRVAFRKHDVDRSGTISSDEFETVLENMNIKLSEKELAKLLRKYDGDGSGGVDYREFMEKFGLELQGSTAGGASTDIENSHGELAHNESSAARRGGQASYRAKQGHVQIKGHHSQREVYQSADAVEAYLMQKMGERWRDVRTAFMAFDKDRSDSVDLAEFAEVLSTMQIRIKPAELQKLLNKYDIDSSGGVNFHEFLHKFSQVLRPGDVDQRSASNVALRKQASGARTPMLEKQLQRHRAAGEVVEEPRRSASVASHRSSRPSTAASDWVHTARSTRSLQAQVQRNLPFISQRLDQMDTKKRGTVIAEDFVVALVDSGVDIGSQVELKNLAGHFSSGEGPTSHVRWKEFLHSMKHRSDQNKKVAELSF